MDVGGQTEKHDSGDWFGAAPFHTLPSSAGAFNVATGIVDRPPHACSPRIFRHAVHPAVAFSDKRSM